MFWSNEQFDASGNARLAPDQAGSFEGKNHLVDRGRADAEVALHVALCRRASEYT